MHSRTGYIYGFACYLWWGMFPLFFALLTAVHPFEIVPWRVLSALAFCAIVVTCVRGWRPIRTILREPKMLGWYSLSSLLLYANWTIFMFAVATGNILESALGYFINPLVTVVIGVVVRRETLSIAQWVAVGIAAVGVAISTVAYGKFPWIAIGLALSFGLYGAVRKQSSEHVDALTSLTVETLLVTPLAVAQMVLLPLFGLPLVGIETGPLILCLLLVSGPITAISLLLFGAANRRLPLSHMGFMQFITPILGFFIGLYVFHEVMPLSRWVGFIAVWIALVILLTDMVATLGRQRRMTHFDSPHPRTGEIVTVSST